MRIRTSIAGLALAALMLTGCSAVLSADPTPTPAPTVTQEVGIAAADIVTIDDGLEWARALDDSADADEISDGIGRIGDLVPGLDIWFADNNKIGGALISLNADVLSDPDNAGTKVDDLNAIIDDLEVSIDKDPNP